MNSPQETRLADELRQIAAGQPFTPDIEAIERRGHQRRRRGQAIRGLAGVAGLGVALTGGLIVGTHIGTAAPTASKPASTSANTASKASGTASRPGSTPPAQTAAYVSKQIAAALSPGNYLVETRQNTSSADSPPAMITIWTDPRTGNTMLLQGSGSGKIAYWEHDYYDSNRVLHWHQTQVNYGPRTWWTFDEHAAGPIDGPVPPGPVGGNYDTPQEIAQLLAHGATIVGHPYVDGHRTVELSVGMGAVKFDIWADSQTYQVVRSAKYFPTGLGAPPIVANYTWLPRSAAQVNLINNPKIPAGFTQVPADGPTG
jgi:hypothetical protein